MANSSSPLILCNFLVFFFVVISNGQEHTWQEAFEALGIAWNPDCKTLNRTIFIPTVDPTPSPDPKQPAPVALSTDIYAGSRPYRLYIPVDPPENKKLPLIIYTHGGDFVSFSVSTIIFHTFCNDIAAQFPAIVVSVEYRHAPENPLPAAYDDALNAVFWARDQALRIGGRRHPWLEYADFSHVLLVGSGAGGNIAYHTALRATDFDLKPLQIKGLLLNQPYFGGEKRTGSEIRLKDDPFVALYVNDVLWTLILTPPVNRDHEFCNPLTDGVYMGRFKKLPRVYVKGDYGDPLVDRSTLLVEKLRSYGVAVVYQYSRSGGHGIEQRNATAAQELYDGMKKFIYSIGEN